jgi:hypothetical protein
VVDETTAQPQPNHWSAYKIRQGKKRAFLIAYCESGSVTHSAEAAGVARCRHYEWLEEDPDYARAFGDVQDRYVEKLEREADRRAVEGVDHPVIYQGAITDTYKEYSDNLLMFRLKGLKPDKYRDNVHSKVDVSGAVQLNATVTLEGISDDELRALEALASRITGAGAAPAGD